MKAIFLVKPIVLRKDLKDMTEKQMQQALRFLSDEDMITIRNTGLKIVSRKEEQHPDICFYGSEAVCIYRKMLGLPDIGIRRIDVDKILTSTWCFQQLSDIVLLLQRVNGLNARFRRDSEIPMPGVILTTEYRILQDYVETLQHNGWGGHPITDSFDEENEHGQLTHYDVPLRSLVDIGFDLTTNKKKEDKR